MGRRYRHRRSSLDFEGASVMDLAVWRGVMATMGRNWAVGHRGSADLGGLADLVSIVRQTSGTPERMTNMQVQVVKVPRFVGKILQVVLGLWSTK